MLVRECLRRAPVTVPPQCTLQEAAALMQEDGSERFSWWMAMRSSGS